ncbi:type II toxin-antitoxin system HipA family toxin [Verrucomicrobiaceae bacterium R5-34]|uniref:Type II toxin-antitoxin system HipA family toxin n=1 Tax=Oceaniferula flava TaxID=2800421 RepID=A0AAE2VCU1_9BACT|nr:type II toxin-antitoxin system HipA family toxin [Oceaniferula flavus]MBK1830762.1 type II toxin-antitoxin system HipA family toxin [Verrucomicrobiaceae bacterium R5-34]MBK1856020.1 type II toxin-antitoxin system HipA family toxin [Oceaniferula flavus]MBM1137327.1 type II toxin-antitoxin system HipA family toxin [Oceaniferula flavus]
MSLIAEIKLWNRTIGAASLDDRGVCAFEYAADFQDSGIEVAPLVMPLSAEVYRFPELSPATFYGLPGLLADSLPDKFGNALIDAWLATQGRTPDSFNVIERLCYTGRRGMGALEFEPASNPVSQNSQALQMDQLVALASEVLSHRDHLQTQFGEDDAAALGDILKVGTSAGGARAKAVIAWNPLTNEVRSGQIDPASGFEHWLLKFDGVASNRDKELNDPKGFTATEYAYAQMATTAGITMMPCRLLEENDRRHFLTKRFDRAEDGRKIHMQSLCAMAHYDFNMAGHHSYEQCFLVMRQLGLTMEEIEQQFRRMAFNIVARNQDDHVKNIAFLMDQRGKWILSPAYDITYSYNPTGRWTSSHQMSMNGKQEYFSMEDFKECAKVAVMKRGRAETIVHEVIEVVSRWPMFASDAGIDRAWSAEIAQKHRLHF